MWEELGGRHPFSLFCGYRTDAVTRDMDAFAEVCRLHGEIVGGQIRHRPAVRLLPGGARGGASLRRGHAERLGGR